MYCTQVDFSVVTSDVCYFSIFDRLNDRSSFQQRRFFSFFLCLFSSLEQNSLLQISFAYKSRTEAAVTRSLLFGMFPGWVYMGTCRLIFAVPWTSMDLSWIVKRSRSNSGSSNSPSLICCCVHTYCVIIVRTGAYPIFYCRQATNWKQFLNLWMQK